MDKLKPLLQTSADGKYRVLLYGDFVAAVIPNEISENKEGIRLLRKGYERIEKYIIDEQ